MTSSVGDVTSPVGAATAVALAVLLAAASLSQRHLTAVAVVASASGASSPSFPWRIPIGKYFRSGRTSALLWR